MTIKFKNLKFPNPGDLTIVEMVEYVGGYDEVLSSLRGLKMRAESAKMINTTPPIMVTETKKMFN